MMCRLHRFESYEQLNAGAGPAVDEATAEADHEATGFGPASFNLASRYVTWAVRGSWAEREVRAAELYAQGFTAFGHLMNGGGPGQPYPDLMEQQG